MAASATLPVVSELVIQGDSIQEILEDSIQEDIVESLNYFGHDIFSIILLPIKNISLGILMKDTY